MSGFTASVRVVNHSTCERVSKNLVVIQKSPWRSSPLVPPNHIGVLVLASNAQLPYGEYPFPYKFPAATGITFIGKRAPYPVCALARAPLSIERVVFAFLRNSEDTAGRGTRTLPHSTEASPLVNEVDLNPIDHNGSRFGRGCSSFR